MNLSGTKPSLNILQVIAQSTWGGGEQFVLDLSNGLVESGHRVSLVSRKSNIIQSKFSDFKNIYFLPILSMLDLFSIVRLGMIIKKESIDVVHVHTFKHAFIALFSCKLFRCRKAKVVLTRHLVKKAKIISLYRWLYKKIDCIVFVSYCSKKAFLSTDPYVSAEKLHVIHNSIHPMRLKNLRANIDQHGIIEKGSIKLGFLGSVVPEKGVEILIKAVGILNQQYPYVSLKIAGLVDESYQQAIIEMIRQQGLEKNIELVGFCGDIVEFMNTVDIGVLPSLCQESFCLSVLEFMAAGKPIITTNNGAQTEIVTDKYDGLLIEPNNPQAIVDAVGYLINNEEQTGEIIKNAPKTVSEKFSYPLFLEKYTALFNTL